MLDQKTYFTISIRKEIMLDNIHGRIICISANYYENDEIIDSFYGRYLKNEDLNPSRMNDSFEPISTYEVTHEDLDSMIKDFFEFYSKHKMSTIILTDGMPTYLPDLYKYAIDNKLVENDAIYYPYPIIDTTSLHEILCMYGTDVVNRVYAYPKFPIALETMHRNMVSLYKFFLPGGGIKCEAND